jgi:hypothetical protein
MRPLVVLVEFLVKPSFHSAILRFTEALEGEIQQGSVTPPPAGP